MFQWARVVSRGPFPVTARWRENISSTNSQQRSSTTVLDLEPGEKLGACDAEFLSDQSNLANVLVRQIVPLGHWMP
jgi:hypothetical protein